MVELTVRAALEESRDHVYQAALLDPNTAATLTPTQFVAMCDDLFAAQGLAVPLVVDGRRLSGEELARVDREMDEAERRMNDDARALDAYRPWTAPRAASH